MIIILFIFSFFLYSCISSTKKKLISKIPLTHISPNEVIRIINTEKLIIIDVRTKNEFKSGHIKNALLIPLHKIENMIKTILHLRNNKILIYCRSGNRSSLAIHLFVKLGFKYLYNLRGGITN